MGMSERIDRVLDDLVKSGAAPGVVAMVVNDHGPLYSGAAGTKGVGRREPMTVDTMFWYASMTKTLVAAGAMQLVEQGRLKLDEPASDILPEFASVQVLDGFEADGAPKLRPAKRPITPRQLLTHTAGYGYNWANGIILRYLEKYELPDLIHCKRRSLDQPLLADPGDRWEYGISIDWIGQLIEKVSGQSLRDNLRKNLFDPLEWTIQISSRRLNRRLVARPSIRSIRTERLLRYPIMRLRRILNSSWAAAASAG
jgi:methyl acetate hydrolase